MFRLTLSRQLALIFAGAMILTQIAVLALDRWFSIELEFNRRLAETRNLAANIIRVLPAVPDDTRQPFTRSYSSRGSQYFLLPEPQAGEDAMLLPDLAAETMHWAQGGRSARPVVCSMRCNRTRRAPRSRSGWSGCAGSWTAS